MKTRTLKVGHLLPVALSYRQEISHGFSKPTHPQASEDSGLTHVQAASKGVSKNPDDSVHPYYDE